MFSPRVEIAPLVWLDARRAVFFEDLRVLVIADLHWGYSLSHRTSGNLLPLWGDDEIETRLQALIAEYTPAEMLWLGDSIHDLAGCKRAEEFVEGSPIPIVILKGNHDRGWRPANTPHAVRGRYFFHHGDHPCEIAGSQLEVMGHHHPAFTWRDGAGGNVKLPVLVAGPRRMILPAFSPWAAGDPWKRFLTPEETLWVIAEQRIFGLTKAQLEAHA